MSVQATSSPRIGADSQGRRLESWKEIAAYLGRDVTTVRVAIAQRGEHVPAVLDPAGQIAAEYGVNMGLPVSVFIDRSGTVSVIQLGQMSDALLQQHLHGIL